MRKDGRTPAQLRPVSFVRDFAAAQSPPAAPTGAKESV
jgi:hypothetical protein